MSVLIREARIEDTENLVRLMKLADYRPDEWSRQKVQKFLKKEGKVILLAFEKDILLGYIGVNVLESDEQLRLILGDKIDSHACVEWIAVHPEYRAKGIASRLLKAGERWAKGKKRSGIWLDCRLDVVPLYEKNGYVLTGSYKGQSKSGQHIAKYVFTKSL